MDRVKSEWTTADSFGKMPDTDQADSSKANLPLVSFRPGPTCLAEPSDNHIRSHDGPVQTPLNLTEASSRLTLIVIRL